MTRRVRQLDKLWRYLSKSVNGTINRNRQLAIGTSVLIGLILTVWFMVNLHSKASAEDRDVRKAEHISQVYGLNNKVKVRLRNRRRQNASVQLKCNFTHQGRTLVADSRGQICRRKDIRPDACCSTSIAPRYSCDTCQPELQCCQSYEYCVSCCSGQNPNVTSATTWARESRFKECSSRCRTTSKMLLHGNRYRHNYRHCYWEGSHEPSLPSDHTKPELVTSDKGLDCQVTCSKKGKRCHEDFLASINTCEVLEKHFQCGGRCIIKKSPVAPSFSPKRGCNVNDHPRHFDCEGAIPGHQRLCVCIQPSAVYPKVED
ncbi:hypothetical protein AAMO2058_001597600 [Amorphochlora amoebiformis]